jgi:hypothetical protein
LPCNSAGETGAVLHSLPVRNYPTGTKNLLSAPQKVSVQIWVGAVADLTKESDDLGYDVLPPLGSFLKRPESQRRPVLQINETVRAYDLAEALRGESGKFEVVTSHGIRFMVTALPGHSIANLRITTEGNQDPTLWIKKIAEFHTQPQNMSRNQTASD